MTDLDEVSTSCWTTESASFSKTDASHDTFDLPLIYKALRVIAELLSVVVAVIGNVVTIIAVVKYRNLKTITNNFVISLSLADLLIVPSRIYFSYLLFTDDLYMWKLGVLFGNMPIMTSQGISLYTLLLIAVDRYIAVTRPVSYKTTLTRKRSLVMIVLVWFTVSCLSLYVYTYFGLNADDYIFRMKRLSGVLPPAIDHFMVAPCITLALGLTIILYARIFWVMKKQKTRVGQLTATTNDKTKKVTKLMATVLGVLLVCWLPFLIFTAAIDPTDPLDQQFIEYTEDACFFLLYTNSCTNPFLYAMKSPEFRKAYRKMFARFLPKSHADGSAHQETALQVTLKTRTSQRMRAEQ